MRPIRFCAWGAAATLASATLVGSASISPATAADLDGCCEDLEQRVAELEATTARKGNRKVSLEIYGQVNRAMYFWSDGGHTSFPGSGLDYPHSGFYMVDNNNSSTRMGLKGQGTIAPQWKSGFNIEFEFVDSSSNQVSQTATFSRTTGTILGGDEGGGEVGPINIRHAYWYAESQSYGRVSLGHQSEASDDISIINLSGGGVASDARTLWMANFIVQGTNAAPGARNPGRLTNTVLVPGVYNPIPSGGLRWGAIANGLDSERVDAVRYDSPSIYGFIVSASYGEDRMWDVALRYSKEWNNFRVAGGVGYWDQDDASNVFSGQGQAGYANGSNTRRNELKGSVSVLHIPTGLYASFAAGESKSRAYSILYGPYAVPPEATFAYIQAGIDYKFLSYGNTTLFADYGIYTDFGVNAYTYTGTNLAGPTLFPSVGTIQNNNATVPGAQVNGISDSDVDRWGLGAVQKFDSAAMELYAVYQHWNADISRWTGNRLIATEKVPTEDFDGVAVGGRVKF